MRITHSFVFEGEGVRGGRCFLYSSVPQSDREETMGCKYRYTLDPPYSSPLEGGIPTLLILGLRGHVFACVFACARQVIPSNDELREHDAQAASKALSL